MSMLPYRVLCLLALLFCCVGVAHAASHDRSELVKEAQQKAKETSSLKEECVKATKAAEDATHEAERFALDIEKKLETIAANPEEVNRTKSEGLKLIDKAREVATEAIEVAVRTSDSAKKTEDIINSPGGQRDAEAAMKVIEEAESAVIEAYKHADNARLRAIDVEDVLEKLDAAVAAAKEKEEKQLESQAQEQTNETSLLPTNASKTNGITRNDGSSSPALLRVPLLLLLLSVLGCMAVC
ncbi:uncharacterized protein TM35_000311500 [Trypanosoma theileri]|uniref:Surface protein TolT n=1 Tax=Trypanosoma theileri TaxID=67003 RepID=A0A1X0NMK0_9TRYP|nr:uncharacterized protein TM35_000311500 [Trypanosoma theileri]ORC85964.1 hypothetical protein TM35_000311500 [Trypanosoma theileri]